MKLNIIYALVVLTVTSCSIFKKTEVVSTTEKKGGSLTYKKNGELMEKPIENDAIPPMGHAMMSNPSLANKIEDNSIGWELGSFNGQLSSENASIQYAMLSRTQNAYFPEIEKSNVFEIKIFKDSTKPCKILNYKFIRPQVGK